MCKFKGRVLCSGVALTSWSTGTTYAPQACGSLRSLYHMPAPLRRSRYQSVRALVGPKAFFIVVNSRSNTKINLKLNSKGVFV